MADRAFLQELKSTLGLHHYRFKKFEKVETWVTLCLVTFVYLEWIRAQKLKQKALKKKEREWWQTQRTYGLALAVRQEAEQRELKLLAEKMETPLGEKCLQAAPAVTSQGVPRGDLIGGSQKPQKIAEGLVLKGVWSRRCISASAISAGR